MTNGFFQAQRLPLLVQHSDAEGSGIGMTPSAWSGGVQTCATMTTTNANGTCASVTGLLRRRLFNTIYQQDSN